MSTFPWYYQSFSRSVTPMTYFSNFPLRPFATQRSTESMGAFESTASLVSRCAPDTRRSVYMKEFSWNIRRGGLCSRGGRKLGEFRSCVCTYTAPLKNWIYKSADGKDETAIPEWCCIRVYKTACILYIVLYHTGYEGLLWGKS